MNQKLDANVHVHAVVPGGGPSVLSSSEKSKPVGKVSKRGDDEDSIGRYLVDAEELRDTYRDFFLKGLTRFRKRNKLSLNEEFAELKYATPSTLLDRSLARPRSSFLMLSMPRETAA